MPTLTLLRAEYAVTVMPSCFMLLTHFPSFLLSCCHGNTWMSGDLLKPAPHTQIHSPGVQLHSGKMLPNDLDSSLANLVGSEYTVSLSRYSVIASIFMSFLLFIWCYVSFFLLSDLQFGAPAKKWAGFPDILRLATSKWLSRLCSFIVVQPLLWFIISLSVFA